MAGVSECFPPCAQLKVIIGFYVIFSISTQPGLTTEYNEGYSYSTKSFVNITDRTQFMIYDVNPGEGFNLRRDVYVRAANLIKSVRDEGKDWVLVVPPWRWMYHWQTRDVHQSGVPWSSFFDLDSMNLYVPVIEFHDYAKYTGSKSIDHVWMLQRHPDNFKNGFKDLIEFDKCNGEQHVPYHKQEDGSWGGHFWGLGDQVWARKFDCVSAQGHATVLKNLLYKTKARSVMVDRFEQVLHIEYGGTDFNRARRSLVFAKHLRNEADKYRRHLLNSTDESDHTPYNEKDWRRQVPVDGSARGGNYLGLHMRRGDFARNHRETVPSFKELGLEVKKRLEEFKLDAVYLSTDATDKEIEELQSYYKATTYRFPRPKNVIQTFLDGGVAIIDQWIVAHARYFIGTCLSTYSFRIHEERDILGFAPDSTYNCICGAQSPPDRCHPPTRWRVKFD